MALLKELELPGGATVTYHRINKLQVSFRKDNFKGPPPNVIVEMCCFTDEASFAAEERSVQKSMIILTGDMFPFEDNPEEPIDLKAACYAKLVLVKPYIDAEIIPD